MNREREEREREREESFEAVKSMELNGEASECCQG